MSEWQEDINRISLRIDLVSRRTELLRYTQINPVTESMHERSVIASAENTLHNHHQILRVDMPDKVKVGEEGT